MKPHRVRSAAASTGPSTAASPAPSALESMDCRCHCGGMLARIVDEGVEIRCRRCKRDLLVPWSARNGWASPAPTRPLERAARPR